MGRRAEPGRRKAILAVARELFRKQGYTRTSMEQISIQSGIAHGTIYYYFDSKLAIVDTLVENYIDGISDILVETLSGALGPSQIRNCVHNILEVASNNPDVVNLLDIRAALNLKSFRPAADAKLHKILSQVIAEGIQRGRFREYDPAVAAALVSGLVEFITRVCFIFSQYDAPRIEETAVQMLEYALIKN